MRTDHRELLAVGILSGPSRFRERIECILEQRSRLAVRTSSAGVVWSAIALFACLLASSSAPRWIAFAQQPPRLRYEVASVKLDETSDPGEFRSSPNGRITIHNIPLALVVASAWNLPFQSNRLTGAYPHELAGARVDIEVVGRAEDFPARLSDAERSQRLRSLLQSVLMDRFKLKMRAEEKTMPVYAIVVAKGGPKLQPSAIDPATCTATMGPLESTPCHTFTGGQGRGLHGQAIDIDDIALFVSNWSDRPPINKTGLKGLYKVDTSGWLRMQPGPAPAEGAKAEDGSLVSDLPTLFGIFDRMGLKLEPQQAPVEIYTIEHIEKPDAN